VQDAILAKKQAEIYLEDHIKDFSSTDNGTRIKVKEIRATGLVHEGAISMPPSAIKSARQLMSHPVTRSVRCIAKKSQEMSVLVDPIVEFEFLDEMNAFTEEIFGLHETKNEVPVINSELKMLDDDRIDEDIRASALSLIQWKDRSSTSDMMVHSSHHEDLEVEVSTNDEKSPQPVLAMSKVSSSQKRGYKRDISIPLVYYLWYASNRDVRYRAKTKESLPDIVDLCTRRNPQVDAKKDLKSQTFSDTRGLVMLAVPCFFEVLKLAYESGDAKTYEKMLKQGGSHAVSILKHISPKRSLWHCFQSKAITKSSSTVAQWSEYVAQTLSKMISSSPLLSLIHRMSKPAETESCKTPDGLHVEAKERCADTVTMEESRPLPEPTESMHPSEVSSGLQELVIASRHVEAAIMGSSSPEAGATTTVSNVEAQEPAIPATIGGTGHVIVPSSLLSVWVDFQMKSNKISLEQMAKSLGILRTADLQAWMNCEKIAIPFLQWDQITVRIAMYIQDLRNRVVVPFNRGYPPLPMYSYILDEEKKQKEEERSKKRHEVLSAVQELQTLKDSHLLPIKALLIQPPKPELRWMFSLSTWRSMKRSSVAHLNRELAKYEKRERAQNKTTELIQGARRRPNQGIPRVPKVKAAPKEPVLRANTRGGSEIDFQKLDLPSPLPVFSAPSYVPCSVSTNGTLTVLADVVEGEALPLPADDMLLAGYDAKRCTVCGNNSSFSAEEVGRLGGRPRGQVFHEDSHLLLSCSECGTHVHSRCYGLFPSSKEEVDWLMSGKWTCEPCSVHRALDERTECVLCRLPWNGCAMKRTQCERVAHVLCLLLDARVVYEFGHRARLQRPSLAHIPELDFDDPETCAACSRLIMTRSSIVHCQAHQALLDRVPTARRNHFTVRLPCCAFHAICALQVGALQVTHFTHGGIPDLASNAGKKSTGWKSPGPTPNVFPGVHHDVFLDARDASARASYDDIPAVLDVASDERVKAFSKPGAAAIAGLQSGPIDLGTFVSSMRSSSQAFHTSNAYPHRVSTLLIWDQSKPPVMYSNDQLAKVLEEMRNTKFKPLSPVPVLPSFFTFRTLCHIHASIFVNPVLKHPQRAFVGNAAGTVNGNIVPGWYRCGEDDTRPFPTVPIDASVFLKPEEKAPALPSSLFRILSQHIPPATAKEIQAKRLQWIEERLGSGKRIDESRMNAFPFVLAKFIAEASGVKVPAHIVSSGLYEILRGAMLRFREAEKALVEEETRERREAVAAALAKAAGKDAPEMNESVKAVAVVKSGNAKAAINSKNKKTAPVPAPVTKVQSSVPVTVSLQTTEGTSKLPIIVDPTTASIPKLSSKRVTFADTPTYYFVESRKRDREEDTVVNNTPAEPPNESITFTNEVSSSIEHTSNIPAIDEGVSMEVKPAKKRRVNTDKKEVTSNARKSSRIGRQTNGETLLALF
jgi:hypothetical protein